MEPDAIKHSSHPTSCLTAMPVPNESVASILRAKRKGRSQQVCQPCRVRKVKCTYDIPCKTCIDRGHPELCQKNGSEQQPPSIELKGDLQSTVNEYEQLPTAEDEQRAIQRQLTAIETSLRELQSDVRTIRDRLQVTKEALVPASISATLDVESARGRTKSNAGSVLPAETAFDGSLVYLGGNSVPAAVVALANDKTADEEVQGILRKSILPIFCLDNESATYPFVDLWSIPHGSFKRIELLCKLLPSTSADCIQLFGEYRDTAHVIYPGIIDLAEFESEVLDFLRTRGSNPSYDHVPNFAEQDLYGRNLHWLGLLFAALAAGSQCSNIPRKERQMKSQVYVCCAYECLRIVNYISRANLVDLQTLVVLGNVLSNNMNAGVAWSLLGLTTRLAQSLGIHYDAPSSDLSLPQTTRSSIWWQIIWQDSLLSITFDRAFPGYAITCQAHSRSTFKLSYIDVMRRLSEIGLDIIQQRAVSRSRAEQLVRIIGWRDKIQGNMQRIENHLKNIANCKKTREQLEFWNLYLHRSYILSEMCRPLDYHPADSQADTELEKSVTTMCLENLANTVEAFLGLQSITVFATQSWAAVHRSLSSALLLSILGEPSRNERARILVSKLVVVFSEVISTLDSSELSAPLIRSVAALQKINNQTQKSRQAKEHEPFSLKRSYAQYDQAALSPHDSDPYQFSLQPSRTYGGESPQAVLNSIIWGPQGSGIAQF